MKGAGAKFRGLIRLNAVVDFAKAIFVGFAGSRGFGVRVFFAEVGVVPFFHGDHGMVGWSLRLLQREWRRSLRL